MSETLKAISLLLKSTRIVVLPLGKTLKGKKEIPLYMRVIYESLAPVQSLKRLNCRRVKSIYCLAAPPAKRSLK